MGIRIRLASGDFSNRECHTVSATDPRRATLKAANTRICDGIAAAPIFEHYSYGPETKYGRLLCLLTGK